MPSVKEIDNNIWYKRSQTRHISGIIKRMEENRVFHRKIIESLMVDISKLKQDNKYLQFQIDLTKDNLSLSTMKTLHTNNP